jgi:hypothetical protein
MTVHSVGNVIIPTGFRIFFRGVEIPSTSVSSSMCFMGILPSIAGCCCALMSYVHTSPRHGRVVVRSGWKEKGLQKILGLIWFYIGFNQQIYSYRKLSGYTRIYIYTYIYICVMGT